VISEGYDGRPACNGCGICSSCPRGSMSKYSLSIWPKALAAGAHSDGAPGMRHEYSPHYYAACIRDWDGNRIEAVTFIVT